MTDEVSEDDLTTADERTVMGISSFEEADRHIDRAWYAALIGATINLVLGAMAILGTRTFTTEGAVYTAGVILLLLLAWGVSRRSRTAAVLLLVLSILRIGFDLDTTGIIRLIVGLALVYLFARGVQGTFAYHRLRAEGPRPMEPGRRASA